MAAARKDREVLGWFAEELRAHRAERGWTQADVARETKFSESLIAQVETCRKAATPELARALDRVFSTPGFTENRETGESTPGTFGRLVKRLRKMPFPASFGTFEPKEAEATVLYTFEHSFVPGLFQTEAYARAVLEMFTDVTPEIVSERLAGRLSRQEILDRDDPPPPVVVALIDQSALLREIGGPKVMRDQVLRLIEVSLRPNITVQVIPNKAAHPGLLGAFTIADLGEFIRYLEPGGHRRRTGHRGRWHDVYGDATISQPPG
jgi:DNA-binding XRE family transcriptional regulator